MNISDLIKLKYPDADIDNDYLIQDDGTGAYIAHWGREEPKPTQKDLDQWAVEFEEQYNQDKAKQEFVQKNQALLAKLDEIDKQSIRAIREANQERINELEAEAVAIRAQFK